MNNQPTPAQGIENNEFITELAIRIANLEIERASYKAQLTSSQQEVTRLNQKLEKIKLNNQK